MRNKVKVETEEKLRSTIYFAVMRSSPKFRKSFEDDEKSLKEILFFFFKPLIGHIDVSEVSKIAQRYAYYFWKEMGFRKVEKKGAKGRKFSWVKE